MKQYAVYVKNGKYWKTDKSLHTLKSAKEMVKGLKVNGEKAFFSKVRQKRMRLDKAIKYVEEVAFDYF